MSVLAEFRMLNDKCEEYENEIIELKKEVEELRFAITSCNDRNKALVEAGWNNLLMADKLKDENQKLRDLVERAKYHVDCLERILPSAETRFWLEKHEEILK